MCGVTNWNWDETNLLFFFYNSERYVMDDYCPQQDSTYALTLFKHHSIVTDKHGKRKKVAIDYWDTAGQDSLARMHPSYYFRAHACILAFDVTRKATYQHLAQWRAELRQYGENIPVLCVANKIDVDMKVTQKSFSFPKKNGLEFAKILKEKFPERKAKIGIFTYDRGAIDDIRKAEWAKIVNMGHVFYYKHKFTFKNIFHMKDYS